MKEEINLQGFLRKQLSTREQEVLRLSSQGLTDKEIADRLDVSLGTIHTYWTRIRGKSNGRTRAEIVGKHVRYSILGESTGVGLLPGAFHSEKFLEAMPLYFIQLDLDCKVVYGNRAFAEFLGAAPADFLGRDLRELTLASEWVSVVVKGMGHALSNEAAVDLKFADPSAIPANMCGVIVPLFRDGAKQGPICGFGCAIYDPALIGVPGVAESKSTYAR